MTEYEKRVSDMLDNLEPQIVFDIESRVTPENRDKFIQTVKNYIDANYHRSTHYIEFSNDYKQLKKKQF